MASPTTPPDTTTEPVTSAASTSSKITTLVDRLCTVPAEMKVGRGGGGAGVETEAGMRLKKELMKYRRTAKVGRSC